MAQDRPPVLTIGLTGGIASGKSTAASAFGALHVPMLNADQVARDVVARGTPALKRIREELGAQFLTADGELDRPKMRRHVFGDAAARRALERITHPAIRERMLAWRDAQAAPYCILDVPILVESGMDALVDRVLVIDAPEEVQVERLRQRDRISAELAQQMLGAQAPGRSGSSTPTTSSRTPARSPSCARRPPGCTSSTWTWPAAAAGRPPASICPDLSAGSTIPAHSTKGGAKPSET
jgi:dephospho-CoA kinase